MRLVPPGPSAPQTSPGSSSAPRFPACAGGDAPRSDFCLPVLFLRGPSPVPSTEPPWPYRNRVQTVAEPPLAPSTGAVGTAGTARRPAGHVHAEAGSGRHSSSLRLLHGLAKRRQPPPCTSRRELRRPQNSARDRGGSVRKAKACGEATSF